MRPALFTRTLAPLTDYVIFDIETTGLSKHNHEIIQISALKYRHDQQVAQFNTYVKPIVMPDKKIQFLTGITPPDLIDAPTITTVMPAFTTFTEDLALIGHNIYRFDLPFITAHGFSRSDVVALDTVKLAQVKLPALADHKLPTLKQYFGMHNRSHNALNDCQTNALVYQRLRDNQLTATPHILPPAPQVLAGLRFAITGEFMNYNRAELTTLITRHGGWVTGAVSGRTDYLVSGTQIAEHLIDGRLSTKELTAQRLIARGGKIQIIDLATLLTMVH